MKKAQGKACEMQRKSSEKRSIGSVINPASIGGSTLSNKTGGWRTLRPVRIAEKCTKCMMCWMYCPDNSINSELEFDYDYCKGCGICAEMCPAKAIEMVKEEK